MPQIERLDLRQRKPQDWRSIIGQIATPAPAASPWQAFDQRERRDLGYVPLDDYNIRLHEPKRLSVVANGSQPNIPFRIPVPLIVPWDDTNPSFRTRRHEQIVAGILNSLIFQAQLIQTDFAVWELGYVEANTLHWSNNSPVTIGNALDRIAVAIKNLTGSGV